MTPAEFTDHIFKVILTNCDNQAQAMNVALAIYVAMAHYCSINSETAAQAVIEEFNSIMIKKETVQ